MRSLILAAVALFLAAACPAAAVACPFCRSVSETVSDKLAIAEVVVIAKRVAQPKQGKKQDRKVPYAVVEILKNKNGVLGETRRIMAPALADVPADAKYVILGALETDINELYYLSPWVVSDAGIAYLKQLPSAPPKEKGVERLVFFQEFLNDRDDLIANDAYDEIARAPFADVKALAPRMHRDKLLAWVADREISAMRRRQYLTMLSVCGRKEDAPVLEKLVLAERGGPEGALDATAACYLSLTGAAGLTLIEERFIKNTEMTRSEGHALAATFRFHGEEEKVIPRERLLQTLRLYLDRPDWADLVMAELARWEDWTVLERMVKLFEEAEKTLGDKKSALALRVPIIKYLQACPKPEANKRLAELKEKHPDVVRHAEIYPFLPAGPKTATRKRDKKKPEKANGEKPNSVKATPVRAKSSADSPRNHPGVQMTALYMLAGVGVLLALLIAILFAFRPRIAE